MRELTSSALRKSSEKRREADLLESRERAPAAVFDHPLWSSVDRGKYSWVRLTWAAVALLWQIVMTGPRVAMDQN
jgi:hypothetical protein